MIARRADLHNALHDVGAHEVDYFDGLIGGHPQGYGWHNGGQMPESEQLALDELAVVRFIVPDSLLPAGARPMHLTPEGEQALSLWDSQFSAARQQWVRCAAEPTQERAS